MIGQANELPMLAWDEVETLNQEVSPGGVDFGARGSKGGNFEASVPPVGRGCGQRGQSVQHLPG